MKYKCSSKLIEADIAQGLVEYSLIISIIALMLILSLNLIGDSLLDSIADTANKIVNATR
jgi:Flp pilus assembly pilin Flp